MKYIDKFLKYLKTDRNTFATYILTLISIYLVIDRFVELFFMFFTGISHSYWGPIQYTLALACPVFAFLFSYSSSFVKSFEMKWAFLYIYCAALYVIGISMIVQWLNQILWLLFISVPNYAEIVAEFGDIIKPAFTAVSLYIPLVTFYPLFYWMLADVQDTKDYRDSIWDYTGINLNPSRENTGAYSMEVELCKDRDSGKSVKILDSRRFEATLVVGASGSGKTTMIFEPLVAKDIEKKFFFQEMAKEMGFTALKTGIANLNSPYANDYLNENFNLNMLVPVQGKEDLYKAYMQKMIHSDSGNITYKNLGITAMASDYESIMHMLDVSKNYHIKTNVVDPLNPDSIGLNPFASDDPLKIAMSISSLLRGMISHTRIDEESSYVAFKSQFADQAIENLSILLKEVYPLVHNGTIPTLEDMLKMLNNFDMIEDLCNELEQDIELSEKYALQLAYFKKNFFKDSQNRKETEVAISSSVTQLDNLLRIPNVKNVLCNRSNNINFDNMLENGEVTFVCTRRGDIGAVGHKAFGLFFLLLMESSVLRRPGTEKTRMPHFLYVDEFADFICGATEPLFTQYRKYRVGTIISVHNLDQLGNENKSKYRNSILANSSSKVVLGNVSADDEAWWVQELGKKRDWLNKRDYKVDENDYTTTLKDAVWGWKDTIEPGKLQSLAFKQCAYKVKLDGGKSKAGIGKLNFLGEKYKELQKVKTYDFSKYSSGITEQKDSKKKKKSNADKFDKSSEVDPVQTDNTDAKYLFDNADAIIVNLKKGNPNNN